MKTKADCVQRIEGLLEVFPNAKIVLVSQDVFTLMKLKGKSIMTSKGRKPLQVVEGKKLIGVRSEASKLVQPVVDFEESEDEDGPVDYKSLGEE